MILTGPYILGYLQSPVEPKNPFAWRDLPRHKDEGQVKLDVDRSFIYYPKSTTSSVVWEDYKLMQDR